MTTWGKHVLSIGPFRRPSGVPCVGQLSANPSLLPNTTVEYYGRVLTTLVSTVEWSFADYIENKVLAGFVSSSDVGSYAKIAVDHEMICFSVSQNAFVSTQTLIPGLFTMLGGPSLGPNALVSIIQHYRWTKVALLSQNAPAELVLSEAFASLALLEGIEVDLQKRESARSTAAEDDFADLMAAKSNVFVIFGGSLRPSLIRDQQAPDVHHLQAQCAPPPRKWH
jgi:hypothetical protein